jgi:hypothetical protein
MSTTLTPDTAAYVITKRSAYLKRQCLLGHGDSEEEAFHDAFGPKPWSPQQRRSAAACNVRKVDQFELNELLWS